MCCRTLAAVAHMHDRGIFHRDIKPENILIEGSYDIWTGLKLADFGSCRGIFSKQPYTEYISTRWYRAPECLLTDGYYGPEMDVWGVGCVFYEISCLVPLFPGENEKDQLKKIHAIVGSPDDEVRGFVAVLVVLHGVAMVVQTLAFFKKHASRHVDFNFPPTKGKGLTATIPGHVPVQMVDLLCKMLHYHPRKRISAREALMHPYFADLRRQAVPTELKPYYPFNSEGLWDEKLRTSKSEAKSSPGEDHSGKSTFKDTDAASASSKASSGSGHPVADSKTDDSKPPLDRSKKRTKGRTAKHGAAARVVDEAVEDGRTTEEMAAEAAAKLTRHTREEAEAKPQMAGSSSAFAASHRYEAGAVPVAEEAVESPPSDAKATSSSTTAMAAVVAGTSSTVTKSSHVSTWSTGRRVQRGVQPTGVANPYATVADVKSNPATSTHIKTNITTMHQGTTSSVAGTTLSGGSKSSTKKRYGGGPSLHAAGALSHAKGGYPRVYGQSHGPMHGVGVSGMHLASSTPSKGGAVDPRTGRSTHGAPPSGGASGVAAYYSPMVPSYPRTHGRANPYGGGNAARAAPSNPGQQPAASKAQRRIPAYGMSNRAAGGSRWR
jgi:serine/threonine protein kinase